jgi:hypothetical protein
MTVMATEQRTWTFPKPGTVAARGGRCVDCTFIIQEAGEGIWLEHGYMRHAYGCPNPLTTREVAQAVGVAPRTKHFTVTDEDGFPVLYDGTRNELILAVLASHSHNKIADKGRRNRCALVAAALLKAITTGRLNPAASMRIMDEYTSYQVCALVARISRDCPEYELGGICDEWICRNHAQL